MYKYGAQELYRKSAHLLGKYVKNVISHNGMIFLQYLCTR